MLDIKLSKKAAKALEKIPQKHAQQIVRKIDMLALNDGTVPTKKLVGFDDLYHAKSGEYRIIYKIENKVLTLLVLRVGKRNDGDVYKKLNDLS